MFDNNRNCNSCNQNPCNMANSCNEVIEPMINNCVEKDYYCEVPHICPINTHTINRIHYVHSYIPKYTCTEETQVINNDCGCPNNF